MLLLTSSTLIDEFKPRTFTKRLHSQHKSTFRRLDFQGMDAFSPLLPRTDRPSAAAAGGRRTQRAPNRRRPRQLGLCTSAAAAPEDEDEGGDENAFTIAHDDSPTASLAPMHDLKRVSRFLARNGFSAHNLARPANIDGRPVRGPFACYAAMTPLNYAAHQRDFGVLMYLRDVGVMNPRPGGGTGALKEGANNFTYYQDSSSASATANDGGGSGRGDKFSIVRECLSASEFQELMAPIWAACTTPHHSPRDLVTRAPPPPPSPPLVRADLPGVAPEAAGGPVAIPLIWPMEDCAGTPSAELAGAGAAVAALACGPGATCVPLPSLPPPCSGSSSAMSAGASVSGVASGGACHGAGAESVSGGVGGFSLRPFELRMRLLPERPRRAQQQPGRAASEGARVAPRAVPMTLPPAEAAEAMSVSACVAWASGSPVLRASAAATSTALSALAPLRFKKASKLTSENASEKPSKTSSAHTLCPLFRGGFGPAGVTALVAGDGASDGGVMRQLAPRRLPPGQLDALLASLAWNTAATTDRTTDATMEHSDAISDEDEDGPAADWTAHWKPRAEASKQVTSFSSSSSSSSSSSASSASVASGRSKRPAPLPDELGNGHSGGGSDRDGSGDGTNAALAAHFAAHVTAAQEQAKHEAVHKAKRQPKHQAKPSTSRRAAAVAARKRARWC